MTRRVYVYRYPEENGRVLRLAYFRHQAGKPCVHEVEACPPSDPAGRGLVEKRAAIREHREKCGDRVTS